MNKTRNLSPMKAHNMDDLCALNRDNTSAGDFWMLALEYVTICHQVVGESPKAAVTIPRKEFNKLIRWYMREQKIREEGSHG